MTRRKQLDRERLQVYYANLLMAYRPLIVICGILLLVYALMIIATSLLAGIIIGTVAVFILSLGNFYPMVVLVANVLAWIVIVGQREDH